MPMPQIDQTLDLFGNERGWELVIATEKATKLRKNTLQSKKVPSPKV